MDYPGASDGSVGAYINNRALVCGGYPAKKDCYYYDSDGTWTQGPTMLVGRSDPASTIFNNQFWVTGGFNPDGAFLKSSELFDSNANRFIKFVDLPQDRYLHNIIQIDDNRAMLLGGQDLYQDTYDFSTTWKQGPELTTPRQSCQAGLVTFENGTKVVVAAAGDNEGSTEFLNLEETEWHFGPQLPNVIKGGASVQLENTFLIVGGNDDGRDALDTIWTFDTDAETWVLLNEHLATARRYTAAFLVPDDFCLLTI